MPRHTPPRPSWRACRDALIFRASYWRRIGRAVHRLRGDGARHPRRSSTDPASVRVREAVQPSGRRRARPLCDDPRPAHGRFLRRKPMDNPQAVERAVIQVEPKLPAPDRAADSVSAAGRYSTIQPPTGAAPQPAETARQLAPLVDRGSPGGRQLARRWILACFKRLTTLAIAFVAIIMGLVTWDYY